MTKALAELIEEIEARGTAPYFVEVQALISAIREREDALRDTEAAADAFKACLDVHRDRAEAAEKERDALRAAGDALAEAVKQLQNPMVGPYDGPLAMWEKVKGTS